MPVSNGAPVTPLDAQGNVIGSTASPSVVTPAQGVTFPIGNPTPAAPVSGQIKIAVTGTRIQLPGNVLVKGVIITAKSTNVNAIYVGSNTVNNVGDGTGLGYILEPGASVSAAVGNTNNLYVNGTAGDIISFIGS